MIGTQARLFSKLIKPEESGINKNEESTAPIKIYRAKKNKKRKRSIQLPSQRTQDQCESRTAIKELRIQNQEQKIKQRQRQIGGRTCRRCGAW